MEQNSRVLIFEKDENLIEIYLTELKDTEFRIQTKIVQDQRSFMSVMPSFKPHLCILSSLVPGFGEIVMWLHQNHQISPVIIIGEKESEDDFRESIKTGAFDYLALPTIYRLGNSSKNAIFHEQFKRGLTEGKL